jgi:sulfotransferase family protein
VTATGVGAPILVGGCSRSGTTLLGAMLGAAPGHLTVPEAEFKWTLYAAGAVGRADVVDVRAARAVLARDPKFGLWDVPLPSVAGGGRAGGAEVPYDELVTGLVAEHALVRGRAADRAWVDHTPGNIRYVATLRRALAGARFVHVVRDGRAVAASVLPLDWGPNTAVEAARHWGLQVAAGLAAAVAYGPDVVHTVRFEDLVTDPERTMKEVCAFAGVDFDGAMLAPASYRLPAYTARQHRLVGAPPDPSRVDAWRERLRPAQVRAFERLTGELLDCLGYPSVYGVRARRQPAREHYAEVAVSAARRLGLDRVRRAARWRTGSHR